MTKAIKKGKQCPGGYWIPRQKKCASSKPSGEKKPRPGGGSQKKREEKRERPSDLEKIARRSATIAEILAGGITIARIGIAAMEATGAGETSSHAAGGKQVEEAVRRARERSRQGGTTPNGAPGGTGSSEEGDDPFSPNNLDRWYIRNQRRKQSADFQKEARGVQSEFGLGNAPSLEEINKARRKAAMKYHPDLNRQPGATDRLQRINEVLDIWEFDAEYRGRSGRKDSRPQNMFVDVYARWDSCHGWSY